MHLADGHLRWSLQLLDRCLFRVLNQAELIPIVSEESLWRSVKCLEFFGLVASSSRRSSGWFTASCWVTVMCWRCTRLTDGCPYFAPVSNIMVISSLISSFMLSTFKDWDWRTCQLESLQYHCLIIVSSYFLAPNTTLWDSVGSNSGYGTIFCTGNWGLNGESAEKSTQALFL